MPFFPVPSHANHGGKQYSKASKKLLDYLHLQSHLMEEMFKWCYKK